MKKKKSFATLSLYLYCTKYVFVFSCALYIKWTKRNVIRHGRERSKGVMISQAISENDSSLLLDVIGSYLKNKKRNVNLISTLTFEEFKLNLSI